jgi:hypothetical protein
MDRESGRTDWRSEVARSRPIADLSALIGFVEDAVGASDRGCWPDEADRARQRPGGDKLKRACWPSPDELRRGEPSPADRMRKATRGRLP